MQGIIKDGCLHLTSEVWGDDYDAFTETVAKTLKKGDKIQLVGFGTFEVAKRAAREGKNPQTGAKIKIPASKASKFKAGKALKDTVNKK